MRRFALLSVIVVAACHSSGPGSPAAVDAPGTSPDTARPVDAAPDGTVATGFGELSGAGCGAITVADLTSPSPRVVRAIFTFARPFVDPDDRPLLTPGGQHMAATPNAGGSSALSEVFAYEELARCEGATFLKSETEIVYDTVSKKTDLSIALDGHTIGVSVTRAFTYPLGTAYTLDAATTLLTRKLGDIKLSTASVSAGDRWDKQFLAIQAFDATSADLVVQAWTALDATTKGDTVIVLSQTEGADDFIYTNQ